MAAKTWVLTCSAEQKYVDEIAIGPGSAPGTPEGWSIRKTRLQGGKQDGVDLIEINNGRMTIYVVPTRGMGVWKVTRGDSALGWKSPIKGLVHPALVPLGEPSGLGWLDGFNELVARCGLESNGAPEFSASGALVYPLHGRIANTPAQHVEVSIDAEAGTIAVTGVMAEQRFHFTNLELAATIVTRFNASSFEIRDRVTNRSDKPASMQMLYHINVGAPLLEEGATVVAPPAQIVPRTPLASENRAAWDRYPAPTPGAGEQVFFFEMNADATRRTKVLLKNASSTSGVTIGYNIDQLPCFSQWKNPAGMADGYATGLEPATNFPNPRSFEQQQGRVIPLAPGQSWNTTIDIDWLQSNADVATAERAIAAIQNGATPIVHREQLPKWCA